MARKRKTKEVAPPEGGFTEEMRRMFAEDYDLANAGCFLSQIQEKAIDWLLKPWVARSEVHILSGRGGSGKSTFLAYLMGQQRMTVWLPGKEETLSTMAVGRLKRHGVTSDRVFALMGRDYYFPDHAQRVAGYVKKLGASLLCVDPFDNYLGTLSANEDGVRPFLESFKWIAEECNCAVVGIRHPGKVLTNLLPGNRAWRDVPRMHLQFVHTKGPPERRVCIPEKNSLNGGAKATEFALVGCEEEPKVFTWGEVMADESVDALLNVTDLIELRTVDEAEDLLIRLLADGEMEAKECYAAAKKECISERTLRRAKMGLGIRDDRRGNAKSHTNWWKLPEQEGPTLAKP